MDFNVKKLASGAGLFFTRAVQYTEEKLGQAEKTEFDAHFENLMSRADCTKHWTEKIYRQTEVLLQPNPSARIEEFLYEKLDRKAPSRITAGELLGQYMQDAAKEFGTETPYGRTLVEVGECERRLGAAEKEFIQTSAISFLTPLRNFLEGDWRTISKERRVLENLRLDLDACKTRLKKAKMAEAKATYDNKNLKRTQRAQTSAKAAKMGLSHNDKESFKKFLDPEGDPDQHQNLMESKLDQDTLLMAPDFQETRPRNYVLSASASALWNEEVTKAEHELRLAQTEFDRQAEVIRLLLEGISNTHVNHLRCLHEFVEAQASYYKQCHLHMQELRKELGRLPNAFALNSAQSVRTAGSASEGISSPVETETLDIEEVQTPATGTRKAKVIYDYDAADSSELSLLADELITVYTVPGMDSDWLIGERGTQKGKVPVTYLELLS